MTRRGAAAGGLAFAVGQPGVMGLLVPCWITGGWDGSGAPLAQQLAGAALLAAGVVVLASTVIRFAVEGLGTPLPAAPSETLVVGGLYRHVRNPMYRRYNACCNEHRLEDLDQFVAADVMINGADRRRDDYAEGLRGVVEAFPDYRWELRHLMVDPPWIATHFTDTGTHRGPYLGVQPSDRSVRTEEFAFYRIDAGQIAEVWGTDFHLQLLDQLK